MNIRTMVCSLLIGVGTIAVGQTSGTAGGTLDINGTPSKLSYVTAMKAQDWTFGADHKPVLATVIRLFIGDAPADDLDDNFELSLAAKQGKLHGLLLTFSSDGALTSGSLYHGGDQTGVESIFTSHIQFERTALSEKMMSGKLRTKDPIDLSSGKLKLNATFSTSFQQDPRPTVEGTAVAETGPGKAAQEFIGAAQTKDAMALKKVVRKEVVEMLEKPEGRDAVLGMLGEWYPAEQTIKLVRLFDFGNRAWVEGASQRKEESGKITDVTTRIRLIRVNGEWKVSPL